MYIHDSHVHTEFSHDTTKKGPAGFDLTVRTAIEQGLSEISICDHCDIDDILDGIYPEFPAEEIKAAAEETKAKLKADAAAAGAMGQLTGGMNIPGLM